MNNLYGLESAYDIGLILSLWYLFNFVLMILIGSSHLPILWFGRPSNVCSWSSSVASPFGEGFSINIGVGMLDRSSEDLGKKHEEELERKKLEIENAFGRMKKYRYYLMFTWSIMAILILLFFAFVRIWMYFHCRRMEVIHYYVALHVIC